MWDEESLAWELHCTGELALLRNGQGLKNVVAFHREVALTISSQAANSTLQLSIKEVKERSLTRQDTFAEDSAERP